MKKKLVVTAALLTLLAGCGGNDNDDDGGTPPPTPTAIVALGPISGFDSVIVNGEEYDVSGATFAINLDDTGTVDQLRPGQIVSIGGTVDDEGDHVATIINYRADARGAVESVDPELRRIVVLGREIFSTPSTVFDGIDGFNDLEVGDDVEVSGYPAADGSLVASYATKLAAPGVTQLRGQVSDLDTGAKTFAIGNETIDYDTATLGDSLVLADGGFVTVQGTAAGSTLTATLIRNDDGFGNADDGTTSGEVSVAGLVDSTGTGTFTLGALNVTTSGTTTYVGGTATDVVVGASVGVQGTREADGSIAATRVAIGPDVDSQGKFVGDVEAVDTAARTVTVLGVTVELSDATIYHDVRDDDTDFELADLAIGDSVEVSYAPGDGGLFATLVERVPAVDESIANGPVDSFDSTAQSFVIGTVDVDASGATFQVDGTEVTAAVFYAGLAVGDQVRALGAYSANVLTATTVTRNTLAD